MIKIIGISTFPKIFLQLAFCFPYIVLSLARESKFPEVVAGTPTGTAGQPPPHVKWEFVDRIFLSFWLRCWEQKGDNNRTVGRGSKAKGNKNNISREDNTYIASYLFFTQALSQHQWGLTWQKAVYQYNIKDNEKTSRLSISIWEIFTKFH